MLVLQSRCLPNWLTLSIFVVALLLAEAIPAGKAAAWSVPVPPPIQGERVALLTSRPGCEIAPKFLLSEAGQDSVNLEDASVVLFALNSQDVRLAKEYPDRHALVKALSASAVHKCREVNRTFSTPVTVYVYRAALNNAFVRTYMSTYSGCFQESNLYFCAKPVVYPELQVIFEKDTKKEYILSIMRDLGIKGSIGTIEYGNGPVQYEARFLFPHNTLNSWIRILQAIPEVEDIQREVATAASTDTSRILTEMEKLRDPPALPLSRKVLPSSPSDFGDRLSGIIHQRYEGRAEIIVEKKAPFFVTTRIEHLRNEVIVGEGFWELLEANFVLSFPPGGKPSRMLFVFLDGKFGTGAGSVPPVEESYISMEPKYYKQLQLYTETLADLVQSGLDKP